MKAKIVNFERGKDPKASMDIGMTPERRLDQLGEKLEGWGIFIMYDQSYNYGKGAWDISIDEDEVLSSQNLQIMYFTDELARSEFDMDGGYTLASEIGHELIDFKDVSHDPALLIKRLLELKYGDMIKIDKDIDLLEKQLKEAKKIKEFLTKG